jgi:hypothetical protein
MQNAQLSITVYQNERGHFKVVYGVQESSGLSYEQAAKELGRCILHALACENKLVKY